MEELTDEDRRALRGSKFAPLPPLSRTQPRLAHPGGPLATNKAAALAKFLERKLQKPGGLDSINPDLIELAVKNAKDTVNASGTSQSGMTIRHVTSFGDSEPQVSLEEVETAQAKETRRKKKMKKKRKKNKNKLMDLGDSTVTKPKKKLKL